MALVYKNSLSCLLTSFKNFCSCAAQPNFSPTRPPGPDHSVGEVNLHHSYNVHPAWQTTVWPTSDCPAPAPKARAVPIDKKGRWSGSVRRLVPPSPMHTGWLKRSHQGIVFELPTRLSTLPSPGKHRGYKFPWCNFRALPAHSLWHSCQPKPSWWQCQEKKLALEERSQCEERAERGESSVIELVTIKASENIVHVAQFILNTRWCCSISMIISVGIFVCR